MNHRRAWSHAAPDLRRWEALERVGTAFDRDPAHDRRAPHRQRPRQAQHPEHRPVPVAAGCLSAERLAGGARRRPALALSARSTIDQPLVHAAADRRRHQPPRHAAQRAAADRPARAVRGSENSRSQRSRPARRVLQRRHFAKEPAAVCRRRRAAAGGAARRHPRLQSVPTTARPGRTCRRPASIAIDPVLGRIALPPGLPADTRVRVDYHYGFGAEIGGGEYERAASFAEPATPPALRVPQDHATIQAALDALGGEGVVEITDSGRYEETLGIDVAAGQAHRTARRQRSSPDARAWRANSSLRGGERFGDRAQRPADRGPSSARAGGCGKPAASAAACSTARWCRAGRLRPTATPQSPDEPACSPTSPI